ncbi:MAG: hypothetical protein K940chlam9_00363 [Chlamydiae bacterium]|nr:hypothetical protein [Chlamydiota bacterium]
MKLLLLLALSLLLTGCIYRMPTEDCISTLPTTNNPHITGEKPSSMLPGKG